MATTVFYAWQSDRPQNDNRYLIRDALRDAVDRVQESMTPDDGDSSTDPSLEEAPPIAPEDQIKLDYDTKDIGGTPHIAETIRAKIQACRVFVADLTFVGKTDSGDDKSKLIPNPNVLIDLGMAAESVGWDYIILVMNTHYGPREALPFDLRHRRFPITYDCPPGADSARRKPLLRSLDDQLFDAIGRILSSGASPKKNGIDAVKSALKNGDSHEIQDILTPIVQKIKQYADGITVSSQPTSELYVKHVQQIEKLCLPLVRATFLIGCRDDEGICAPVLQGALRETGNRQLKSGTVYPAWIRLQVYPAMLLLYAAGIGALCSKRFSYLRALWLTEIDPGFNSASPSVTRLFSEWVLMGAQWLPDMAAMVTPGSLWTLKQLNASLLDLLPMGCNLTDQFHTFELFAAAASLDAGGPPFAGAFVSHIDHPWDEEWVKRLKADITSEAKPSELAAGLFGKDPGQVRELLNHVLVAARSVNPFSRPRF